MVNPTSLNKSKILAIIVFVFITAWASASAQIQSVNVFTDYSGVMGKRFNVDHATAMGVGANLKFKLAGNFSLGLTAGYRLYSIRQANQLFDWNWKFWNDRYYTKIVSDLKADPSLSVNIGSVQKMDAIPVILHLDYNIAVRSKLTIVPSIGGGIIFYTRKMFAVETWSKQFNTAGNYVFTYSFRNFAPDKTGNPLLIKAGLDASYKLFSDVNLSGGAYYTYFIPTGTNFGYFGFPFKDELNLKLGLNFIY